MIIRFSPDATLDQRARVEAQLREIDVRAVAADGALLLRDTITIDEIYELGTLPGVAGVTQTFGRIAHQATAQQQTHHLRCFVR